MRIRSDSSEPDGFRRNFRNLFRRPRGQDADNAAAVPRTTNGNLSPSDEESQNGGPLPGPVILTFEQNLRKHNFYEASQLLSEREECLFGGLAEVDGLNNLSEDHKVLENHICQTLRQSLSLSAGGFSAEALKSAVKAIYQEEKQDQLWEQRGGKSPAWRPRCLKELHDKTLRRLAKDRIDNPLTPPASQAQQSSFETNINNMGRQLKEDLLLVVDVVKPCYPPEMDICNFYARLYHSIFSARLRDIASYGLEDRDSTFLLRWVNEYYPELLQKSELATNINAEALGKLLPKETLEPLEDQYLARQEAELMTYVTRVLDEAIQRGDQGEEPMREDGCYVSPVAYDTIQFINGMGTSAQKVVGDQHKAQRLTKQLNSLMHRFKTFQDMVIVLNRPNSKAIIKANLGCVEQFSDFLTKKDHLFPEDVRKNCLHVLKDMKESAHTYLLSPVHLALKPHYRKLGTSDWLKRDQFRTLLGSIEQELHELQGSKESCHQELIRRFYQEVTVEYVRRLLKGGVKLKDKEQQTKAYETMKDNAEQLHTLFAQKGANEAWLKEILIKIAEVLKLQDLDAIQIDIASLGSSYPDLSERHVSALLKLKTNISKADRRKVKETLTETLREDAGSVADALPFFSKIQVR